MFRNLRIWTSLPAALIVVVLLLGGIVPAGAQQPDRRSRIDVQDYVIRYSINNSCRRLYSIELSDAKSSSSL